MWSHGTPCLPLLVGMSNGVTLGKRVRRLLKQLHRVSIRSSNSTSGYTLKRSASRDTNRYFACPHSRRAEGGNVSACCWVNGETWANIQPRKGVKADTGCNTGDPEDPAQSKGDTRGQAQHDPTGRRRPEQSLSLIHISEPTRPKYASRMPSSA